MVQPANREQKRLFDFSVRLIVKRPQDKAAAAPPPAPRLPARRALQRREEGLRRHGHQSKSVNVDLNSVFERRGVAVPRAQPERAWPMADPAEGR